MINLQLITLTGAKIQEDVYEVILPTADGAIAAFEGHMPLVSVAVPGVIGVRRKPTDADDKLEYFATNGGIIEVSGDTIKVLVDEADRGDEISEQEARQALERAEKMKADARDKVTLEQAQSLIDRQAVRLRVAELRRHNHRG